MRFQEMKPLQTRFPNVEISDGSSRFDLHNSYLLTTIEYRFMDKVLTIGFRRAEEAAGNSSASKADLTLEVGDVAELYVSGNLSRSRPEAEPLGLDFIEYVPTSTSAGQIRFVLDNFTEITVVAESCRLCDRETI
jgi:hypothetical protein